MNETLPPIEVPIEKLSADALENIVREFILREGTDYGAFEMQHETKIKQVHTQIKNGDVRIVYDPNTESVTLMTHREFKKQTHSI